MYRNGHIGAALLFYAPIALILAALGALDLAAIGAAAAGALSVLPDYDQRIPGVRHRGPTHTAWFAVLVGVVAGAAAGFVGVQTDLLTGVSLAALGFLVASLTIASHIAADALTPMGVTPFAPWSSAHYSYHVARASNPLANAILLGLGSLLTLGALALGDWLHAALA